MNNVGQKAPESFHYMEMIFLGFYALELILRFLIQLFDRFSGLLQGYRLVFALIKGYTVPVHSMCI